MQKHLVSILSFVAMLFMAGVAFAEDAHGAAVSGDGRGWAIFGLMVGMGLATFGGALGQGKAAAAALEGIARNPEAGSKVQTPMIIGLALIESLVLYSLLIAILLLGKL